MTKVYVYKPTQDDAEDLKVGDMALDPFGNWNEVVEITYRGIDIHGKAYVGFYTKHGENGSVSNSYKDGEVVMTMPVCQKFKRRENVTANDINVV